MQRRRQPTAFLLLLMLVAMSAASGGGGGYCGDGIYDPYSEQCDQGLRLVEITQSLPWVGIGTPQATRTVSLSLMYAVCEFLADNVAQQVYGLSINNGGSPQAITRQYGLSCSGGTPFSVMEFTVRRTAAGGSADLSAAVLRWSYNTSAMTAANITTCSQFFTAPPAQLAQFVAVPAAHVLFQWTGAVVTDVWTLSSGAAGVPGMLPNTVAGTVCCSSVCKRTPSGLQHLECTESAGPSNATETGLNYYCLYEGDCVPYQTTVVDGVVPTCGNGLNETGEECDNGLIRSGSNILTDNFGFGMSVNIIYYQMVYG